MNWFLYIGVYAIGYFTNLVFIRQFVKVEKLNKSDTFFIKSIALLGAFIYVWFCWKFIV